MAVTMKLPAALRALFFVLVSISVPLTGDAQTREPAQGIVAAKRYAAVNRTVPVSIEVRNFQDLNDELITAITGSLRQEGFTVSDDSALVLFIDTNATARGEIRPAFRAREVGVSPGERTRVEVEGEGNVPSGPRYDTRIEDQVKVPFDLEDRPASAGGLRYRVTATLSERGKTPLWTGSATAVISGGDRRSIFAALGREITSNIGQSVEPKRIEIREAGGIVR